MPYQNKAAENKIVAKKCMELKAYSAGVTRAYYSAFLHIKNYLIGMQRQGHFDYNSFLKKTNSTEKEYSHGTLQAAVTNCLMANGKKLSDVYKMRVLDSLYEKRRRADYGYEDIVEPELEASLEELDVVLSVVA